MVIIENKAYDEERALYGSNGVSLVCVAFDGIADGESALKESKNINAEGCRFNLRYPLWHCTNARINKCKMTEACRAPLWYSSSVSISHSELYGTKAVRECEDIKINNSDIVSDEFGWKSEKIEICDSVAEGQYFMLEAKDVYIKGIEFTGKYSFQYIENAIIENSHLDTKDAFWHAKNVTVRNCTVKGEYLAWYCENVTFEKCKIIGTQPFCYCRGLKLIDCEMLECDLAFEKSEVEATVTTPVISIKNPKMGNIVVPSVGEIIMDDKCAAGKITVKEPTLCR